MMSMNVWASVTDNAKLRGPSGLSRPKRSLSAARLYAEEAASHVGFAFPRPAVPDLNGSDDGRCTDTAVIPLPPQVSHEQQLHCVCSVAVYPPGSWQRDRSRDRRAAQPVTGEGMPAGIARKHARVRRTDGTVRLARADQRTRLLVPGHGLAYTAEHGTAGGGGFDDITRGGRTRPCRVCCVVRQGARAFLRSFATAWPWWCLLRTTWSACFCRLDVPCLVSGRIAAAKSTSGNAHAVTYS